jgi:hypothetical protein
MSTAFKDISYDLIKGIYTQLNSSVYQRCDTITLSGTSGTALITNNGVSKTITFSGTLTATAAAFVATNAAAYLAAGTVLTSSGATLIFTASVLGASFTGATTIAIIYNDWFLLSKDELKAVYNELKLYGIGNILARPYWSSTEKDATNANITSMASGGQGGSLKSSTLIGSNIMVRACRAFTSTVNYNLRDIGPAGGYIFWKSGNDYLELAPIDTGEAVAWSNIDNAICGASGTAIGTGQANTLAIIGQAGHTASAAKLCDDLVTTGGTGISGTVTNVDLTFGLTYPVYKSIPKPAATTYIYIGNVINDTDGTKDEFHYNGTCQIQVVDESKHRADSKLALNILNVIRGILKPTRGAVFSISPSTLVVFEPGPYNEVIEENNGVTKIKLIDIYNFLIT